MSDNGKEEIKEEVKKEEPKPITLVITLMPNGQLGVSGPIQERMLCYGMLDMAREIIFEFKHSQKVVTPNKHGILNFARFKR